MPRPAASKDLTLKALELFQICAERGSLQRAATETGLTISTVSHHLRNLENHLGVDLFDHARRPMVLTPKGRVFLRNIDAALIAIRQAVAEASSGSVDQARHLRIGTIEDFESDLIPELAVYLSGQMPACDFLYQTDVSHRIIDLLRNRHLDLGITTLPEDRQKDVQVRPLLRDPFVVVVPRTAEASLADIIAGRSQLPFLRFSSNLIIARHIDSQLRRLGMQTGSHFECSNNQTLMAMVAAGAGWAITTPLLVSRAKPFQAQLVMHRFPKKSFARTLALVATPDCAGPVLDLIDGKMRQMLGARILSPQHQQTPWLAEDFRLLT
ncbi:LysR family transcriptional regulator [Shimia sp. R10_1]|uniref:LysR family transcriptional regulator n=1 Tax=Shimia sp. R10_1 TaxID=2821095 RepID=UPI001AD98726|nr:LysR family transcriptional regulator [Shimia sp. R10_1]MBO9474758.1 LysR family transcriptional regulator [Shimia sp. R10_1]